MLYITQGLVPRSRVSLPPRPKDVIAKLSRTERHCSVVYMYCQFILVLTLLIKSKCGWFLCKEILNQIFFRWYNYKPNQILKRTLQNTNQWNKYFCHTLLKNRRDTYEKLLVLNKFIKKKFIKISTAILYSCWQGPKQVYHLTNVFLQTDWQIMEQKTPRKSFYFHTFLIIHDSNTTSATQAWQKSKAFFLSRI